jgi:hypothetical protein
VAHAVDLLVLASPAGDAREWVIGTDALGSLLAVPASERAQLPASVQAQLAHHEVASGRRPRQLAARGLFLFAVELAEHPASDEGLNDPVYLYGTLSGPWGEAGAQRVPGQLALTRGDLLEGFVQGAPHAFRYAAPPERGEPPRAFHALLPGDRPELLAEGEGLVLAYPVVPAELQEGHAANGAQVASLLHDVLLQLQEDVRKGGGGGPLAALASLALPVPSRALAIAELELDGWSVQGDVATRRSGRRGLAGKVADWLGERMAVPREAPPSEFLSLAGQALSALPGWPGEAQRALRARVHRGGAGAPATGPAPRAAPAPMRPVPPRAPAAPARKEDWMRDFLAVHAPAGGPPPRLTRMRQAPARPAPPAPRGPGAPRPEWLADFAPPQQGAAPAHAPRPAAPAAAAPAAAAPAAAAPEWMKDFED